MYSWFFICFNSFGIHFLQFVRHSCSVHLVLIRYSSCIYLLYSSGTHSVFILYSFALFIWFSLVFIRHSLGLHSFALFIWSSLVFIGIHLLYSFAVTYYSAMPLDHYPPDTQPFIFNKLQRLHNLIVQHLLQLLHRQIVLALIKVEKVFRDLAADGLVVGVVV